MLKSLLLRLWSLKRERDEKKLSKNVGSSMFGPYILPVVTVLLIIVIFMMTNCPSGSIIVVL